MPGFALAKNCRVAGLARRDPIKAEESARQYGIPLAFASAEDLCRSEQIDAIFVASPNACHLPDVVTALGAGKPVLCEKPMGVSAEECRQMVEAARQARLALGIAQVFRFEDSTAWLRDRIHSGQIGRPIFARSEFSFPAGTTHPRQWLYDAKIAGGGPIADIGVHCIDALRFILQDEVLQVEASATRDALSGELEATAAMILEFSKATLAGVLVSFRAEYRTPLEFVGETGVLRADNGFNVDRPVTVELRRGWDTVASETVSNHLAYARQVDAFAASLEGGPEFPASGIDGWQNQEILDAAYRSIKSGRREAVPRLRR
jgi:predicted dehydrogenase